MLPDQEECPFPPHPGHDYAGWDEDGGGGEYPGLFTRLAEWRAESPLDRSWPLFAPFLWGAAEVMTACHVAAAWPGAATAAVTLIGGWSGAEHVKDDPARLSGPEVAGLAAGTGGWLTLAGWLGPLTVTHPWWASPALWLPVSLAGGAWGVKRWLGGHRWIRAQEAAAAAVDAAAADKAWWRDEIAPLLGLGDYYLIGKTRTLLGWEALVGTSPQGKRASQVYQGRAGYCETLAHYLGLDFGTVDMDLAGPGRLKIRARLSDPWAEPVWHPVLKPDSPYARHVPERSTITRPLCVGVDPETGRPLQLTLWDERGAKVVAVFAKKDAGKTTLLDSLTERVTACDDARLLQMNLSKALEDSWWAGLADANALDTDVARAFGILRFASDAIRERPRGGRRNKVLRPSPARPAFVLKIDEIDAAIAEDPVRARRLLGLICGKCRSEGIAVVLATQRGIQQAIGGGQVQMNIDIAVWGKFARPSELVNVAGREAMLPDMGEYGQRHPGVFGITELPFTGEYQRGRAFYWGEDDTGHRTVVDRRRARRAGFRLEPELAALSGQWERICAPGGYDWQADPEWGGGDPGDQVTTAAGEAVPGAAAIRRRVGEALAAAGETYGQRDLDEAAQARLDARIAAENREFRQRYADVNISRADLEAILRLLDAGVVSAGDVAEATGKSRATAHRYLARLVATGHAEQVPDRQGNEGGYRAPAGRPDLRIVKEGDSP